LVYVIAILVLQSLVLIGCAGQIRNLRMLAVAHDAMIAELQELSDSFAVRLDALDIEVMDRSL
jgi:hypothetical protein